MKNCFLIIGIVISFSACSGSTNQNSNAPANANAINANTPAATNSGQTGVQPYNGVQNLNPNAFNAANDKLKVVPVERKKDELPLGSRLAPDDSFLSSASRGKDFIETRTFRSHAVLDRIEKIMDGRTTKIKVYLKNGKSLDVPPEKITSFASMAPINILIAAGIEPTAPTNPASTPPGKKDQE